MYNKGNYKQNLHKMVLVYSTNKGGCKELCINKKSNLGGKGPWACEENSKTGYVSSQKHIKRCLALVVVREMYIKTTVQFYFAHIIKLKTLKRLIGQSVGKYTEP